MVKAARRARWSPSDRRRCIAEREAAENAAMRFLDELAGEPTFLDALADWRRQSPGAATLHQYALIGVLARFQLPRELSGWAAHLAAHGVSDRRRAQPFLERHVGPSFLVDHRWLGGPTTKAERLDERIHVAVPKSWSKTRVLAYVEDQLDRLRREELLPGARPGRPRERVTAEQDAERLLEFDRLVAAGEEIVAAAEGPPFKRRVWSAALGAWLGRGWPHRAGTVLRLGLPVLRASGHRLATLASRREASRPPRRSRR